MPALTRALLTATFFVLAAPAPARAAPSVGDILGWPLRWVGGQIAGGGVDKLKGAMDATIGDVDVRLTRHEDRIASLAGKLLADTKAGLDDSVDKINHGLEARILQLELGAGAVVDRAVGKLDSSVRLRLIQAEGIGQRLVRRAGGELRLTLREADGILRARSADLDRMVNGFVANADATLTARIDQIDEVAARRLGNVDVIASKQWIALERTGLRVAVLIVLVAFVGFVIRRMWDRYHVVVKSLAAVRGASRALELGRALGGVLVGPLALAAVGGGILFGLYVWLPMGAAREQRALVARHRAALDDSLLRFDAVRARFHASQLEFLAPEDAALWQAQASKAQLVRDLVARPAMLATQDGLAAFDQRVQAVERLLGRRPDPDLLVLKATVAWQGGATRAAEQAAAALSARALRLGPRGFALAPLARAHIESFLEAPFVTGPAEVGRRAASVGELRAVLAEAPSGDGLFLASTLQVARLMRQVERASTAAYVKMVEAHARADSAERRAQAQKVVDAWLALDAALLASPRLAGDPAVLAVFRLNDAVLTRALWYLERPPAAGAAPLLESLGDRLADVALKLKLAPPRVAWARRYQALIRGPGRQVFEFDETERFRDWEKWTRELEEAHIALQRAPTSAPARWRAAMAAAALGLYVDPAAGAGTGPRESYARRLAGDLTVPPDGAMPGRPATLKEALESRGPSLL